MAVMHFNENIGRPTLVTETGSPRTRLALPPSTRMWVAKRKLEDQTFAWRDQVLEHILNYRLEQSAIRGHSLYRRALHTQPRQSSFVPQPPREELEEQYRKRRKLEEGNE